MAPTHCVDDGRGRCLLLMFAYSRGGVNIVVAAAAVAVVLPAPRPALLQPEASPRRECHVVGGQAPDPQGETDTGRQKQGRRILGVLLSS